MIDISEATKIIDCETRSLPGEKVALSQSVGRILRDDIVADTDLPPFDRSQMDGFAVIASETTKPPVSLRMVGESAAGNGWNKTMNNGQTVRIMTGARVPAGADSVQRVELANENIDGIVEILEATEIGRFIVGKGDEIKKGKIVFQSGETITENMIAALAAFGYAKVAVGKQPRVAILGTGSEIVEFTKKPGRDQIRNSNTVMLDVLSRKLCATTETLPIVKDNIAALKSTVKQAAEHSDILVLTGGVSVGKYDHTKAALEELGAEIFFDKLRLKPGKPVVFARLGNMLIFGLPGNPVSAAVTFHLFVRKAILAMQGATSTGLKVGFAVLATVAKAAGERDTFLPSRLESDKSGHLVAHLLRWQGSSDFVGFAGADSLVFVPRGKIIEKGEVAQIAFL